MVESAPQWIIKEMKKEDAEAIQEKLKAVGAEVKLVWMTTLLTSKAS